MIWIWIAFVAFVLLMLGLDLGVFNRKAHATGIREALIWSVVWVSMALLFSVFVYYGYQHHWLGLGLEPDAVGGRINDGRSALLKYLTGYLIEKSLSADNIFVIAMIFGFFAVPAIYQHRVLFWGIMGALILRGLMIALGAGLIHRFHWILYAFGLFLIVAAFKMLFMHGGEVDPQRNLALRLVKRFFRVTDQYHGKHFLVRDQGGGGWALTPLAVTLVVVETMDVIFAVDSIPAVFVVTADPFLVFTSNVFAILGLRSLYFALAGMIDKFHYLKTSLAIILAVVGVKMLLGTRIDRLLGSAADFYLLGLVMLILAGGVVASMLKPKPTSQTK